MSEEIKSLKEYISTTKNEIFTTFKIETISNLIIYYEELDQKVKQLENIRKEAIEYINKNWGHWCSNHCKYATETINILNKGSEE